MSSQNISPDIVPSSTKSNQDEASMSKGQSVAKRLQKELCALMMSTEKSVSAFPENENFFRWIGTITGPKETVYENQRYRLLLEFPNSYPYSPPSVQFLTKCFHPNIDLQTGALCLDILKEKWSALYDVRTILLSIQSLLGEPNNESPLNGHAANLWADQASYKKHLDAFYEKSVKDEA